MVLSKLWNAGKWTAETVRGAAVVLASPNAPIPETKLHPRMPARPSTIPEFIRMLSWRHMWQWQPAIRLLVFSAMIVFSVEFFLIPVKPRHLVMLSQGKENHHKHEREHMYGRFQKRQDELYFAKYDPFRKADAPAVGGH